MGVLVASKASETPLVVTAGQQDTRHLFSIPWLAGDPWPGEACHQMGDGGPARGGRRHGIAAAPSRSRRRRRRPVCSCRCRWTSSTRRWRRASRRTRRLRRARAEPGIGDLAARLAARSGACRGVLIGDDVPADAAGAVALALPAAMSSHWRAAHLARRVPRMIRAGAAC